MQRRITLNNLVINLFSYQNMMKWKIETRGVLTMLTLGGLLSNIVFSNILLYASSSNYPGGLAFARLHEHMASSSRPVNVHICNYAAQTGVSRFGELRSDWRLENYVHIYLDINNIVLRLSLVVD